uniref:Myosin heavy chain, fast skeletal muscle-like n=1 Tax=Nicotiana tabacum TaxID=4097 RepID=A0A1S4DEN3_TOBAC|nr:PREDICTED: myosin heavy chain, fast skeletal muscle-like [Nicotiana tabacum]
MTMRSVTLEVPANHSLLRKIGRADVWLEPLIGDIEKKKMESHSCLTLMNDVVHSTLKANLISTELMRRISSLERKARESEKSVHEAEEIARGAQLEATNWKEQFENAQGTIEELQENKNLLEASEEVRELKALLAKKEEYAGELVQNLTQAQADLQTSSEYGLLEENFNIEVSWAFLNSRRDALTEAAQEGFDLQSELAKVIDTIAKSQQSTDTPSPALEVPENVAIPASEGETSTTQSMEVEASVTIPLTE